MWTLDSRQARLSAPWGAASLDLNHPELGLTDWRLSAGRLSAGRLSAQPAPASPLAARLLQAVLPDGPAEERLVEAFVRGDDLIATYREGPDQVRVQCYWRQLAPPRPGVLGGLEWIVAVQTLSLDCRPELTVSSTLPAGTTLAASSAGGGTSSWVFRPANVELSYVELVYPADWGGSQVDSQREATLVSRLRLERLEKGVIRSCRVRGWWVTRDGDAALAAQLAAEFFDSPPPLTA